MGLKFEQTERNLSLFLDLHAIVDMVPSKHATSRRRRATSHIGRFLTVVMRRRCNVASTSSLARRRATLLRRLYDVAWSQYKT